MIVDGSGKLGSAKVWQSSREIVLEQVAKVAKIEGKKHQASIGDIREILKIIVNLIVSDSTFKKYITDEIEKKESKKEPYHG